MHIFTSFLLDRSGTTAVEYGLIAGLISIGLIGGLSAFSDELTAIFLTVDEHVKGAG